MLFIIILTVIISLYLTVTIILNLQEFLVIFWETIIDTIPEIKEGRKSFDEVIKDDQKFIQYIAIFSYYFMWSLTFLVLIPYFLIDIFIVSTIDNLKWPATLVRKIKNVKVEYRGE